jgi:hypothetical protein
MRHVLAYNLTRVINILGVEPSWQRSGHSRTCRMRASCRQARRIPLLSKSFDTTKTYSFISQSTFAAAQHGREAYFAGLKSLA